MRFLHIPASFLIILIFAPFFSDAQLIKERFDKLSISENFDSINSYWTTMANAENLFIVQDGEYILQRKSAAAPFAIIANFEESFNNFRAIVSIKLDKTAGEESFGGFLFMMQPEGEGGFLFEINKNKEFRIRQIVNGVYKYLTGNSKSGGWIKCMHLNEPNFSNMVEVRNLDRNYDIYINHNFIQSFSEPSYKEGKMGLIVGPSSRCKVDFMYVFTKTSQEVTGTSAVTPDPGTNQVSAGPDIIELTESIIRLKTQINTLTEENDALNKTISAMNSGDQEKDVTIRNLEKQVKRQQEDLAKKDKSLDSLVKVNADLMKYKELAGGNENADLIIVLSKSLKAEKEKNTRLEQELKDLKAKNGNDKSSPKGSVKTKPDTGSTGTNENTKKESNIFKLPED